MQLIPHILARDLQALTEYYMPLGFEVRNIIQEADEILFFELLFEDQEDQAIHFSTTDFWPIKEQKAEVTNQNATIIYIEVKDANLYFEEIKNKSKVLTGLSKTHFNEMQFVVEDPEGNKIAFFSK